MIALLVILVLVAIYVAVRFYSASKSAKRYDTQPVLPRSWTPPPDTFGEKFPNPTAPLKTETLEEWLNAHPERPSPLPKVETKPEPKPFLAGKLLPPTPHPMPPAPVLPHVRKRKRKK